jgi:hypothetical protein
MPTAVGVYGDKLRAAPVTFDAPAQNFVGGLRVCAFVQIVPAPQTTLSSQDIVIPIRAPTGTLQVQATTASPFVGGTFAVRLSGSSEAANGNLFDRVQRGPCTPLSANAQTNLEGNPITAGAYDMTLNAGIDGSARVLPDRVCGWLYSDGGLLLATSQQLISPQFDGSLVVTKKRFISFKRSGEVHWLFYFESHTTGKITAISFRHVSGGRCLAFATRRKGSSYKLSCLLASRPRAPFVFEVKYTTGLGAARSTGHVSLAAPKQRRRPA